MKVSLGTVQWGQTYGLSDHSAILSNFEISSLIKLAIKENVYCLDTSQNYGDAEELIGKYVGPKIPTITKINIPAENVPDDAAEKFVLDSINISRIKLRVQTLAGVLVHNTDFLYSKGTKKYIKALSKAKHLGLIHKFGFSIYDTQDLTNVTNLCDPDIVQVPLNVFNQEFITCPIIEEISGRGCEIHARSIFLQGLLLSKIERLSKFFKPYEKDICEWNKFCMQNKISPMAACLDFIKTAKHVDVAILGVNSTKQFRENISAFNQNLNLDYSRFSKHENNLTDPRRWRVEQ